MAVHPHDRVRLNLVALTDLPWVTWSDGDTAFPSTHHHDNVDMGWSNAPCPTVPPSMSTDRRDGRGLSPWTEADERGVAGDPRGGAAKRDHAGDEHDRIAEPPGISSVALTAADVVRAVWARKAAADDRARAARAHRSNAVERGPHALGDESSLADRTSSAADHHVALIDGLTGVYSRAAGVAELGRDIARARRTNQRLVAAFVDVDYVRAVDGSRGDAAGDGVLVDVARALCQALRSYDLVVRYDDAGFVCAISGLEMTEVARRLASLDATLARASPRARVRVGLAELQLDDSPDVVIARATSTVDSAREASRVTTTGESRPLVAL
jgi:diguanylate cyclase (GGDEF)-like protein